jgi:hypothetical protein
MALNKAQLLTTPGPNNPGVIGAVKAGANTEIVAGVLTATGGGVGALVGGQNITVSPPSGETIVTVNANSLLLVPNAAGEDDFPPGTVMSFCQATAPVFWTKNTGLQDATLRVVSGTGGGTGGSANFTTAMISYTFTGSCSASYNFSGTTSSVSLTPSGSAFINTTTQGTSFGEGEMSRHNHVLRDIQYNLGGPFGARQNDGGAYGFGVTVGGQPSGNNGAHSHGFSGTATLVDAQGTNHSHSYNTSSNASGSLSGGGTANLAVKYVDILLCTKN